jgi:hypothetical protein
MYGPLLLLGFFLPSTPCARPNPPSSLPLSPAATATATHPPFPQLNLIAAPSLTISSLQITVHPNSGSFKYAAPGCSVGVGVLFGTTFDAPAAANVVAATVTTYQALATSGGNFSAAGFSPLARGFSGTAFTLFARDAWRPSWVQPPASTCVLVNPIVTVTQSCPVWSLGWAPVQPAAYNVSTKSYDMLMASLTISPAGGAIVPPGSAGFSILHQVQHRVSPPPFPRAYHHAPALPRTRSPVPSAPLARSGVRISSVWLSFPPPPTIVCPRPAFAWCIWSGRWGRVW